MDRTGMSALPKMDPTLLALIERARTHVMTPEERRAQRLSFVMGMLPAENPLTRDQVREIIERDDGVSPPPVAPAPAALLPPDLDATAPRWSAWSELEVDSDPSDPCCGHATVWYVGVWPASGGEPVERVTIGSAPAAEHRARSLADRLNTSIGWTAKGLADHSILHDLLNAACDVLYGQPEAHRPGSDTARLVDTIEGALAATRATDGAVRQSALIHAAILHEREACAFLAECHSGLWDPATIEQIAANIRARGAESGRDLVHLDPDRYGALLAAESELQAIKARTAPKDLRDAISAACFDPRAAGPRGSRTTDEWRADAVMAVLTDLGVIPGEGGRHG